MAKAEGRGTHRFFEAEMDDRLQARCALELDLRSAINRGQFELYYQPIWRVDSVSLTGFEALLRWNHPEQGQISPLNFIPLAEETGLILPIGEWVLRTACNQAAKWPEPVEVSINLSPGQFKSSNLVQTIINVLGSSGLSPRRLVLEITETALLCNETAVLATLHQLREMGVQIALDDFGTGYSSLAYLRSFPFDKIKIDRSFVRDMLRREDCKAIVEAIASLAHKLNMTTVVEGIESQAQLDLIKAQGCDECQGFLLGRPVPKSEVMRALHRMPLTTAA
jgi:EAL domain-containing protein (putative c-di-GMP-specific phosphodiesterase class I)